MVRLSGRMGPQDQAGDSQAGVNSLFCAPSAGSGPRPLHLNHGRIRRLAIDVREIAAKVEKESAVLDALRAEIRKVLVGQDYLVERLLLGLLTNHHVLIEGVPGLAKTLSVTTLARAIHAAFRRIQFTPDLLPADLIGTLIYNPRYR